VPWSKSRSREPEEKWWLRLLIDWDAVAFWQLIVDTSG